MPVDSSELPRDLEGGPPTPNPYHLVYTKCVTFSGTSELANLRSLTDWLHANPGHLFVSAQASRHLGDCALLVVYGDYADSPDDE